jgi:hypothetical protein
MGLEVTPEESVREITSQLEGQNWIQARTAQVQRAVESLPTVKHATIGHVLDWPPRLVLDIEERQPFLKVGAGQDWWVVDGEGIPFRRATAADTDLYAVTGPKIEPQPGHALPQAVWHPVAQLAAALAEDNQRMAAVQEGSSWKLRRIYLDKNGFAAVRLKGGAQDSLLVRLGDERWQDKLQRARQALAYFQSAGARAEVLNLVSFNMPTWTPHRQPDGPHADSDDLSLGSSATLPLARSTADDAVGTVGGGASTSDGNASRAPDETT